MIGQSRNRFISGGRRVFNSLQNPGYRLYFLGMLGQFASMNMQMITSSLLLYRLTGSAALLGTISLMFAIPMLCVSLFGGAIADRVPKKQIIVLGLIGSAIISFGVALALATGYLSRENAGSWWILMASSLLQGTIMGMMLPARQAIIPELVSKEQLMNAIALNNMGMNVFRLLAPGVAGFLVDAFDFKSVYYTMTAVNVYAGVMILFVPPPRRKIVSESNILADIQKGISYVLRDKIVSIILAFTLIAVVFSMPYQQLLPIFVDDILKVGATGMGILMSVSGAGSLVGSLVLAAMPNKKRGIMMIVSGLFSGLALIAFALSTSWNLSLATIIIIGLGQTGRVTVGNALLQSYVEEEYMGRVMSIFMMEWGLVSLCTFTAGVMAEVIPVQFVVGGLALLLAVLSALVLGFVPSLRKLD
jgi:MFS family permease